MSLYEPLQTRPGPFASGSAAIPPNGLAWTGNRFEVNGNLERALKQWEKNVARPNRAELRRRRFAVGPSLKRRLKDREAAKRSRKTPGRQRKEWWAEVQLTADFSH